MSTPVQQPERTPLRIVAVAASAGGLAALTCVFADLPADVDAAFLVVQHLSPNSESHLAEILARRSPVRVVQARAGERIVAGTAYIAPPDYHLVVGVGGRMRLNQDERVQYVRPSADCLFESVATQCGARAIAVVLTGMGRDGASGVASIKKAGGIVIAQDEASAEHFSMPGASIRTGNVDHVLPLDQIAPCLLRLLN